MSKVITVAMRDGDTAVFATGASLPTRRAARQTARQMRAAVYDKGWTETKVERSGRKVAFVTTVNIGDKIRAGVDALIEEITSNA